MTSEYKLAPDDTMEAYSGTELATKQKIFGRLFLRRKKMLIHFNQFFGLSNYLAQINNEKWELECSFAISEFISKYNLA